MRNTIRNILLSLLFGGLFFWLAIRNVPLETLLGYMKGISYGWIIPYSLVALFSHFLRAERWRLLISHGHVNPPRISLFTGVMFGYLVNYAIPRLGEITRCLYVAKKEELNSTNLIGTVILERVIDMLIMLVLMAFVAAVVISDVTLFSRIFDHETLEYLNTLFRLQNLFTAAIGFSMVLLLGYLSVKLMRQTAARRPWAEKIYNKAGELITAFIDGLLAIRHVRHWPYFAVLSVMIWLGYAVMAYIPFFAFNLHEEYGLGFIEAVVIMTVSTIGVALPSPGGMGTYHWFVRQGLLVLYGVPAAAGLAYAFVTHAALMAVVLLSAPALLVWNNLLKKQVLEP